MPPLAMLLAATLTPRLPHACPPYSSADTHKSQVKNPSVYLIDERRSSSNHAFGEHQDGLLMHSIGMGYYPNMAVTCKAGEHLARYTIEGDQLGASPTYLHF